MRVNRYHIKGPGSIRAKQEAQSANKNLFFVFDYTRDPVQAGYYLIDRQVNKNELAVMIKELRKEEDKQALSQTEITWFAPEELQFIMIGTGNLREVKPPGNLRELKPPGKLR